MKVILINFSLWIKLNSIKNLLIIFMRLELHLLPGKVIPDATKNIEEVEGGKNLHVTLDNHTGVQLASTCTISQRAQHQSSAISGGCRCMPTSDQFCESFVFHHFCHSSFSLSPSCGRIICRGNYIRSGGRAGVCSAFCEIVQVKLSEMFPLFEEPRAEGKEERTAP